MNEKKKAGTNVIIIFICSSWKSGPLRDTHIVTQRWNSYPFIPAELLQSGMAGKIYIKEWNSLLKLKALLHNK